MKKLLLYSIGVTLSLSVFAGRRDPDEMDPTVFVKRLGRTYTSLVNDPLIKKGLIKDYLQRKEFADLGKRDLKFISQSLVQGKLISDLNWKVDDTKIIIDDKRVFQKPVEIDFKDYTRKDLNKIYFNGVAFELKFTPKKLTGNETSLVEQMNAIEKFFANQKLQAWLPFLNDRGIHLFTMLSQGIFFPLTSLTGCEAKEYGSSNGILGNVGVFFNNVGNSAEDLFDRTRPTTHGGAPRPPSTPWQGSAPGG